MMIPDHDGRADGARLDEALTRIDADRRLYLFDGDRRVFRAAAAWDATDPMVVHRELGLAVEDIARRLRMSDFEVRRLLMTPGDALLDEVSRILRRG